MADSGPGRSHAGEPGDHPQASAMAHIALAYNAALRIELRHAIRAVPHAVLAANARIRGMQDNSRRWIFCVRLDWASLHAFGVETVIAPHRQVTALRIGPCTSLNLTKAPPVNLGWIAVLFIAGNLAGTAADALGHIEMKAILFTLVQCARFGMRPGAGIGGHSKTRARCDFRSKIESRAAL